MAICKPESNSSTDSLTHAPSEPVRKAEKPAQAARSGRRVSSEYQRARVNVFVEPAQRHQLDALSAEMHRPLTEVVRHVLRLGLSQIMQADLSE